MGNTGEDTVKRSTQTMGSTIVAILLGGTIGLVALLLLTLLTAALVWSGALPPSMAGILLTGFAGVCAFVGGRIAVQKGRGPAMPWGRRRQPALRCFAGHLLQHHRRRWTPQAVFGNPADAPGRWMPGWATRKHAHKSKKKKR